MEPLHITEFASDRYFQKLSQLKDADQPATHQHDENVGEPSSTTTLLPTISHQQSPFYLPIRGLSQPETEESLPFRAGDHKRPEKQHRFHLSFRHKLHIKSSSAASGDDLDRRLSVNEPTKQSLPFDQLFYLLPTELQTQIIASLPLADILTLRLASKSMHALVTLNESPIVRFHLDHHIPAYAKRLYPVPSGKPLNFHYLCGLWHRLHVAAKMSDFISEWLTKEIFLRDTPEKRREFGPQRERMRRRLIPLLFVVFHFFEKYRELNLEFIRENGHGLQWKPYTINPVEGRIMAMYDDRTLLHVHQVFPVVIASFCRRLRPPTYIGRVERSIRGYLREKPPDEVHTAILCLGGLREVERIWEVKGYMARRGRVDNWYNSITRDPVESEPKKKRGMLGLVRKKSSSAAGKAPASDASYRTSSDGAMAGGNLVFNTSLASGRPMDALPRDQVKMILADLPVLQKIWLQTAEATILDRKIVERPVHIKRNAEVMLELIREEDLEEDQWWYGMAAPASVRPNLDALFEDEDGGGGESSSGSSLSPR